MRPPVWGVRDRRRDLTRRWRGADLTPSVQIRPRRSCAHGRPVGSCQHPAGSRLAYWLMVNCWFAPDVHVTGPLARFALNTSTATPQMFAAALIGIATATWLLFRTL